MSSLTPNYNLIKPSVNDPVDQDLWGGMLNTDMDIIDTTMKNTSDRATLPIGSLYFNASDGTNPATLLGYGTWVAFGAGRIPIGVGSGTDANGFVKAFTAGQTGGEYQHTQLFNELAAHSHDVYVSTGFGSSAVPFPIGGDAKAGTYGNITGSGNPYIKPSGISAPMQWMQPYITVYIWQRTV